MTSLDKSWQVLTSLKSCILPIAHVNACDTLAWLICPKYTWVTCCHVLSCFFAGSAGAPLGDFPFFRCCVAGRSMHWIHAIGLQDKDGVVSQNDFMIFMKDTGCLCRNRLATGFFCGHITHCWNIHKRHMRSTASRNPWESVWSTDRLWRWRFLRGQRFLLHN